MSKKPEYGVCFIFQNIHYYIPFGKVHIAKEGDIYYSIGDSEKGGHISQHKSGEIHYREKNGEEIKLSNEDIFQPLIDNLNQLKDMTSTERKFVIKMLKVINAIKRYDGCFYANCNNKFGMAINFDVLRIEYIEFMNKYKKMAKQILGEILDKDEDEDEDYNENDKLSQILNKMKIEKIPECKYCKDKSRIYYKKKKYIWKKCPRCKGLGFDLDYLGKYRVDL